MKREQRFSVGCAGSCGQGRARAEHRRDSEKGGGRSVVHTDLSGLLQLPVGSAIATQKSICWPAFIMAPITPVSVLLFSVSLGSLWLATVPLTSGLIAHFYGFRYMGTLYGLVFFSHPLGSFLGVWLGGRLYDTYGDYTAVWWIGVAVGPFSTIVRLPVKERRLLVN